MISQTLNNRYHITALLGKGAMGEVYRATDTQTGQDVAVKVLTQDLAFDQEMLERFRREGEALRRLRHPNIVGFVDMFQFEGHQAIVMEYVPGGNLHALIKKGLLPLGRVQQIALDLCDALTRAHRLNIVHRDIKPENVLIAEDDTPKLTDFGVARLLGETTRITSTGALVGTPYYMSPEAWQGKTLDEQTDIWSLGVVLFELVTGQVPFTGETLAAVMNKVLTTPPPALKTLRPDVTPALVKVIQRMLMRDKANRYASTREVALDLERVMKEEGKFQDTEGAAIKADEPRAKARGVLPVWAVVTLVMAGLLAVGGLGVWVVVGRSLAPPTTPTATQHPSFTATAFVPIAILGSTEPMTPIPAATSPLPEQATQATAFAPTATLLPTEPGTAMPTATETLKPPLATETSAPTLSPTPSPQQWVEGAVLLDEKFAGGKTTTSWNFSGGDWKVVQDGKGNYALQGGGSDYEQAVVGDVSWRNYAFEVKTRAINIGTNIWGETFDLIFRKSGPTTQSCNQYKWNIFGAVTSVGRQSQNSSCNWFEFAQHGLPYSPSNWASYRIEVEGDRLRGYRDGAIVFDVEDPQPPGFGSGLIGLLTGPNAKVWFTDVRVIELVAK